jgi:hydroxymethylpyrimidine/phosphomethylpyrimidine kinase
VKPPPRVLIVAGSDSGGGAGIQADIKTVTMLGGFATTALTAITAQNSLGVQAMMTVPAPMVLSQIESVLGDIGADAVKIGMVGSAATAAALADRLARLDSIPIVFDPVMVATRGETLADSATIAAFETLIRRATLVTPNAPELAILTGREVRTQPALETAARDLAGRSGAAVLAKGGHLPGGDVTDLLAGADGSLARWTSPRIDSRHRHGTGCTLASAIAVHLARGRSLEESVERARTMVRIAILAAPGFGAGHGPMGHCEAAYGEMNLNQVTVPAEDHAASVAFYRLLGLAQIVDSPGRYARFEAPGGATLSIHVEPGAKAGGAIICLETADLDSRVEHLRSQGIAFDSLPEDKRWGWREAHLRDPAGNRICLYRAGEFRRFPPSRPGKRSTA